MNTNRASLSALLAVLSVTGVAAQELTPIEELGRSIFFDTQLSIRNNQSCADCHDAQFGGTGPLPEINRGGAVYEGSVAARFSVRKPPSSAYTTPSPVLHYVVEDGEAVFVGGNFWDGRATGEELGNPAAEQAQGPFLNVVEQALPDAACVVHRVCNPQNRNQYPVGLEEVWSGACDILWPADIERTCSAGELVDLDAGDRRRVNAAFDQIALSIAAYEASPEVNQYTSKFDAYQAGEADLTAEELQGLDLFIGKGQCAACHILDPQENGDPPLFTDFTFDNLGVPRNPDNPVYDSDPSFVDHGLGEFLATRQDYAEFATDNIGKQKVPTLRNVDLRPRSDLPKAYMHNGYFKTLEGIVNFYNTRDLKPECADPLTREADALRQTCWPAPEVAVNVNTDELGNLGLSPQEEAAIVAFMKTLSDGYVER